MSKRIAIICGGFAFLAIVGCGISSNSDPAPAVVTPTTVAALPSPAKGGGEQANAAKAAADYLDSQAFSRKGLIGQLKYDGYPADVATKAVDSLHTDWNNQAALMARNYLDAQTFSRKSLAEQLKYEGFTTEQAAYGVAHSGL